MHFKAGDTNARVARKLSVAYILPCPRAICPALGPYRSGAFERLRFTFEVRQRFRVVLQQRLKLCTHLGIVLHACVRRQSRCVGPNAEGAEYDTHRVQPVELVWRKQISLDKLRCDWDLGICQHVRVNKRLRLRRFEFFLTIVTRSMQRYLTPPKLCNVFAGLTTTMFSMRMPNEPSS